MLLSPPSAGSLPVADREQQALCQKRITSVINGLTESLISALFIR
jgi:hypothetical protein